jgi:hypothetical protein
MRGSSGSPALLEGSEQSLSLVTEAKARELLVLGDGGLATQFSPASTIEPGGLRDELLPLGRILLPPLVVGRRAPVAQQIGIPVLAAADAAVARLESTNAALHVVVCPGKVLPVIALHQVRPQVGTHVQAADTSVGSPYDSFECGSSLFSLRQFDGPFSLSLSQCSSTHSLP